MKSSKLTLLTCSLLTLLPISCSEDNGADHAVQYQPNTSQKADTKFLRFTDESRGEGVMEAAIATYEGKNGEKVELISAVHVADTAYYERLEKLFAGDRGLHELHRRVACIMKHIDCARMHALQEQNAYEVSRKRGLAHHLTWLVQPSNGVTIATPLGEGHLTARFWRFANSDGADSARSRRGSWHR